MSAVVVVLQNKGTAATFALISVLHAIQVTQCFVQGSVQGGAR